MAFLKTDLASAALLRGPEAPLPPPDRPDSGAPVRVLTLLCQKPAATGSGIVLKEMIDQADSSGAQFAVLCAGYPDDEPSRVFARAPQVCEVLRFGTGQGDGVPFPIVGMSNQMPYPSVRFGELSAAQLQTYLGAWRAAIRAAIGRHRPHVLHVHHLWLLAALTALEADGRPVIVTVHGTDLFRADDCPHLMELVAPWARRFARVLTLTQESASRAAELYSLPEDALTIAGNGFNRELFHPERRGLCARAGSIPESAAVVLTVAQFDRRKGIEWTIRGFARGAQPQSVLVIAGSGPEHDAARYREIARECGVGERVLLLGAIPYEEVGLLMCRASIFVLPAFREPFGLVILEALACGCRVVTTAQAGPPTFIPESLRASGDAILVPGLSSVTPASAEAERFVGGVAAAIATHAARPLELHDRKRIADSVQHLTWQAYATRLGAIYRAVLS